ncbi:MAG TPA: hypothetical protein VKY26_09765, partial [Actinomycetota bacterium]|nr:hypothetical protein [Actinomycetota bacterium]
QQYVQMANPAFALGSTLLDTPVRSPTAPSTTIVLAPNPTPAPSGFAQTCSGGGGGGLICSSTPLTSQPATITRTPPESDRVQAGLFRTWPIWQAYTFVTAIVVIILVALSVAILSRRHARVGRRRRTPPGDPLGGSGPGGLPGPEVQPGPATPTADAPELVDASGG